MGIPVHETVLGRCRGKIVVGCRDFTADGAILRDFGSIKNTVDEDLITGTFGSSPRSERFSDVLSVIEHAGIFDGIRDVVTERFWDMFVVDAFIHNGNRSNGNWGLLVTPYNTKKLAPVFGNGNAFFNKCAISAIERRLMSRDQMHEDVMNVKSFFTDEKDVSIKPFEYMMSMEDAHCNEAVLRFAKRLDMSKVESIVSGIPEEAFGLTVMPPSQKEFYVRLLHTTYDLGIRPVVERLTVIERHYTVALEDAFREYSTTSHDSGLNHTSDGHNKHWDEHER